MSSAMTLPVLAALLTTEPHLELVTMGPGDKLVERFGHAALCVVHDSAPEQTRCYNYGTTDFDTPPQQLAYSFLRGGATFWVSQWRRVRMLRAYIDADRSVWRQKLSLSAPQTRRALRKLAHDAREENRRYAYHHFHDNCATRVRDIIDEASANALSRFEQAPTPLSYRELGRLHLQDQTALLLASDLLVGREADRQPNGYQAMFLPALLRAAVAVHLGAGPVPLHARTRAPRGARGDSGRLWAVALGLLLACLALGARNRIWLLRLVSALSGVLLGALGAVVWAVAIVSHVPELRLNEALLLFWPTDVLLAVLPGRYGVIYARVRAVVLLCASLLLAVGVLVQPLAHLLLLVLSPMLALALPRGGVGGPGGGAMRSARQRGAERPCGRLRSTSKWLSIHPQPRHLC